MSNPLRLEQWPIGRLRGYEHNPRKNDEVVDKMVASIKEFGFRIPIVAQSDGLVVDGHLRLKAAIQLGLKDVPVVLADELTEPQVKGFRLLANKSANWADWDNEKLAKELESLSSDGPCEVFTGFSDDEIEEIASLANMEITDVDKSTIDQTKFGRETSIKVVLPPADLRLFELAIQKTGKLNRAEAVRIICEAYYGEER
jgi:ParB-like chromosome segregation protein Spo0J